MSSLFGFDLSGISNSADLFKSPSQSLFASPMPSSGGMFPWKSGVGTAPPAIGSSWSVGSPVGPGGEFFKTETGGMAASLGGKIGSDYFARGGPNTGGMFTQIGTAVAPGIGTAIGFALDITLSSSMSEKAQEKARDASREFWRKAQFELGQLSKGQVRERGQTLAMMGASGASLTSGSFQAYRTEQRNQQSVEYNRMKQKLLETYYDIRESGGKGGRL